MLITQELANTIARRAMNIIHHNVNVIDHQGIIIASGETHRIGELHEIAIEVIKTRQRITIENTQQASKYHNVNAGINHPIIVDDQVVLVIGVSGNPAAIGRYAELAILTAELLIKQSLDIRYINWQYRIRDLLLKQYLEHGDSRKGNEAVSQLKQQSIDLNQRILPILIDIETGGNLQGKTIDGILNQLSNILKSQRVILLNNEEILLIITDVNEFEPAVGKINDYLTTQLSHYTIGVGVESASAPLFRRSMFMLKEMIAYGKRRHPQQKVLTSAKFAFIGLLDEAKSSCFTLHFHQVIQQILRFNTGQTLLDTLAGYIENNAEMGNAAKALGIHRNTLTYRLNQIREITTLDPFSLKELSQLMIALHYHISSENSATLEYKM